MEALARRLHPKHIKLPQIKKELTNYHIGYRGEQSLDYYFNLISEQYNCIVLHDIRLQINQSYFQMDTLVIDKGYIAIFEIKNLAGSIHINGHTKQAIRTLNGHEEVIQNPLLQSQTQKFQLKDWLVSNGWPLVPLLDYVILSDPSTRIISDQTNLQFIHHLSHAARIPDILSSLSTKYSTDLLSKTQTYDLSQILILQHTRSTYPILKQFNLHSSDILKGVLCPKCPNCFMIRGRKLGYWHCPDCFIYSKTAHIQALQDYSLLLNDSITNYELRSFLNITSPDIAYRILTSNLIPKTGTYKNRTYTIPYPLLP